MLLQSQLKQNLLFNISASSSALQFQRVFLSRCRENAAPAFLTERSERLSLYSSASLPPFSSEEGLGSSRRGSCHEVTEGGISCLRDLFKENEQVKVVFERIEIL